MLTILCEKLCIFFLHVLTDARHRPTLLPCSSKLAVIDNESLPTYTLPYDVLQSLSQLGTIQKLNYNSLHSAGCVTRSGHVLKVYACSDAGHEDLVEL